MSKTTPALTDELLRRALSELGTGPDSDALLTDVLRRTDDTPQLRRRPWDVPSGRSVLVMAAAALMLTGIVGASLMLSGARPQPRPTPSAPAVLPSTISVHNFVAPFTYSLPPGQTTLLTPSGSQTPAVMLSLEHIDYAPVARSRHLLVFLVTGTVHPCGPSTTPDPQGEISTEGTVLSREPSTFLQQLRDTVGVGVGSMTQTTLGNLPAVRAEIDPTRSACQGTLLHEEGFGLAWATHEPKLNTPSTLIVARAGNGVTIGVLISASTVDDLASWLPIAQAYVDSFVFEKEQGTDSPDASPAASAPAAADLGSQIVVQHWNGLEGTDSVVSHLAFAPGAAEGVMIEGLPPNTVSIRRAPDGSRVVYSTAEVRIGGLSPQHPMLVPTDLYVADGDASNATRVAIPRAVDRYASYGFGAGAVWSPTSAMFALQWSTYSCSDGPDCVPPGGYDIFDRAGSLVTTIQVPDLGNAPIWSPDGRSIGWFTGACPGGQCATDAFNWRRVGGDSTVTSVPGRFGQVVWAPDGRLHAVTLTDAFRLDEVLTMAPDGGAIDTVDLTGLRGDVVPIWSLDGRWLAQADRNGTLRIRDAVRGTDVSWTVPAGARFAAWSPDSRSIALFADSPTDQSGYAFLLIGVDSGAITVVGDGEDFSWLDG